MNRNYFIGFATLETWEKCLDNLVFASGHKDSFKDVKEGDLGILYVRMKNETTYDNDKVVGIFVATSGSYRDDKNPIFGMDNTGRVKFPYRVKVNWFFGELYGYKIESVFALTIREIREKDPNLAQALINLRVKSMDYKLPENLFKGLILIAYSGLRLKESERLGFDNIVGFENLKDLVGKLIPKNRDWDTWKRRVQSLKLNPKIGILLFGPPGTGKTFFAKTLAWEIEGKYFEITASDIQGYPGEAEERIKNLFNELLATERAVLFVDEAEWILRRRDEQISSVMQRVTPTLLSQWSRVFEYEENYNLIFIIMTTNKPDMIDEAFLRTGRFDWIFYAEPPTEKHIKEMLKKGLENLYKGDLDKLVEDLYEAISEYSSKGEYLYSASDIMSIIKYAKIEALNEGRDFISEEDISNSLDHIRPSISGEMVRHFEEFAKKWNAQSVHKEKEVNYDEKI